MATIQWELYVNIPYMDPMGYVFSHRFLTKSNPLIPRFDPGRFTETFGIQPGVTWKMLDLWYGPLPVRVTTRIFPFSIGVSELNLYFPLLQGGGIIQD